MDDIGASVIERTMFRNGHPSIRRSIFGGSQFTQDIARQYGMSFEEAELPSAPARCPTAIARPRDLMRPFMDSSRSEVSRRLAVLLHPTPFNQVDHVVLSPAAVRCSHLGDVVAAAYPGRYASSPIPSRA